MSRKAAYQRARRARIKAARAAQAGGGQAKVEMSPQDAYLLQDAENYVNEQNKSIPSYIKSGMSEDEMQAAIVSHIRNTGERVGVSGRVLLPTDVDARFPAAKDSRFTGLIDAINATDMRKLPKPPEIRDDREGTIYRQLEQHVQNITSKYSTRELRDFVSGELGARIYRGGRPEYLTTMTLALTKRFESLSGCYLVRNRLDEMSSKVKDFAGTMHSAVSTRDIYAERVAAIRAKYKGMK